MLFKMPFFVCVKDPFNSHLQEKSSWVGRELLKGSEDLHPTFMHYPRNLLALEGQMIIGSADLEGGEEGKADKPLLGSVPM